MLVSGSVLYFCRNDGVGSLILGWEMHLGEDVLSWCRLFGFRPRGAPCMEQFWYGARGVQGYRLGGQVNDSLWCGEGVSVAFLDSRVFMSACVVVGRWI